MFSPAEKAENPCRENVGIKDVLFENRGGDYIALYEKHDLFGYSVGNRYGVFIVAIKEREGNLEN
jgi:hypothetical protein